MANHKFTIYFKEDIEITAPDRKKAQKIFWNRYTKLTRKTKRIAKRLNKVGIPRMFVLLWENFFNISAGFGIGYVSVHILYTLGIIDKMITPIMYPLYFLIATGFILDIIYNYENKNNT